jgi:hypothetical protein
LRGYFISSTGTRARIATWWLRLANPEAGVSESTRLELITISSVAVLDALYHRDAAPGHGFGQLVELSGCPVVKTLIEILQLLERKIERLDHVEQGHFAVRARQAAGYLHGTAVSIGQIDRDEDSLEHLRQSLASRGRARIRA